MIANCALFSSLVLLLGLFWIAGETTMLAPYRRLLFTQYGVQMGLFLLILFFNLFALCYAVARVLFLRDTGRKLTHVDQQLGTADGVHQELVREGSDGLEADDFRQVEVRPWAAARAWLHASMGARPTPTCTATSTAATS